MDAESTLQEWLRHPTGGPALADLLTQAADSGSELAAMLLDPEGQSIIGSFPLKRLAAFPGSPFKAEGLPMAEGH